MPSSYTAANITRFGGPDDLVDSTEAATGFSVTGTANYAGSAPVIGSTVQLVFGFNDAASQTVSATIQSVDAGNLTANFIVADPSLTLPEGPGGYYVRVSKFDGSVLGAIDSPFHAFTYVTCFVKGTRVATPNGTTPVEKLAAGDLVLTASGEHAPVKWIGHRHLTVSAYPRREMAAPVRIAQDAFAAGVPSSDLLISPDHAVLVDGRLICARQLVNGASIQHDLSFDEVDYLHVELEQHGILIAEGLTVESYLNTGNRGFFSNAGEPLVLRPDLSDESDLPARQAASCVPFATDAETVRPIWEKLAVRAVGQGAPVTPPDTTVDPDLRIVAKGKTLMPIHAADNLYIFVLPKGVTEVRIRSHASVPSDVQPWLDDRRLLGVGVQRIIVRSAEDFEEIAVDSPHLGDGWWQAEGDGRSLWRWTNGEAALPVPLLDGPRMLELRIAPAASGYLAPSMAQARAIA